MDDDKTIKEAIHASVAKAILEGLDTGVRDSLLQKSITDALSDYKFRNAVAEVVADKARRVAAELVESEQWEKRIVKAIMAGFDTYLLQLAEAIPDVIKQGLHGKDGDSYSKQVARILQCWPKHLDKSISDER